MSIWQTKSWQEMLVCSGQSEQFFVYNDVYIEKRKVSFGQYGLFVVGYEGDLGKDTQEYLIELCKRENALFVQCETINYTPPLVPPLSGEGSSILPPVRGKMSEGQMGVFREGYYKKFITPYTAVIELEKSEDDILAGMKQKGRYNIKLAEKKGIKVRSVDKNEKNIQVFYDLLSETTMRDNFSGNTMDYYREFLHSIKTSRLLLAYKGEKVVAGGIFVFEKGVSFYYYGASTSDKEYRNMMAPYLLQWEAIVMAKGLGSKIYDFLGVASPGESDSSLVGVTDFKGKFTSDVRQVSESYIWINRKIVYTFIVFLKKLRMLFR